MARLLYGTLLLVFLAPGSMRAEKVTCESIEGRLKECAMDTRGDVRMIQQLSNTQCTQGVNWGINRNSVWVKDGCRAVFESDGGYQGGISGNRQPSNLPAQVTCESDNNRSR